MGLLAESGTTGQIAVTNANIFPPALAGPIDGATLATGARAVFHYVGQTQKTITPAYVFVIGSVAGVGTQVAEVGIFSSPLAPNRTAQTLTKVVATGTVDDLTVVAVGGDYKGNSTAFTTAVAEGVHLWAAFRCDMSVTEPQLYYTNSPLTNAGGQLIKASASALTSYTTLTTTLAISGQITTFLSMV